MQASETVSQTQPRAGRLFHAFVGAVATAAVVLQLVLIVQGSEHVAVEGEALPPADLDTRLVRFVSYLTIWSNVLVAATSIALAVRWERDGRWWRALRLNAVVLCFGGGVVHFFLLRPILDLSGADLVADRLLHMVVPGLALLGWLAFGPRGQVQRGDLKLFLVLPVVWIIYTLIRGAFVDWYPYPFIDVDDLGYPRVLLNTAGVTLLMLALFFGSQKLDGALPRR